MTNLLGLEPIQKSGVDVSGWWWWVVGSGQMANALVQTLDLGLEAWTKLNKNMLYYGNS